MKRISLKILTVLTALMLVFSLLPIGAIAATVDVFQEIYDTQDPVWEDAMKDPFDEERKNGLSVTIKTSDYSKLITVNGKKYDLKGVYQLSPGKKPDETIDMRPSVTVSGLGSYLIGVGYVPHEHEVSRWIGDTTTHWRHCLECEANFLYQNWHHDLDENKLCDICGDDIVYYDITILESEGGKVSTELESAPYRHRIYATATADAGYTLKEIRFYKVRHDGSRQRIVGYPDRAAEYYCTMPTYDLEIEAEFIKN